ncbi:hypothetical protein Godav_003542, partial [Gossypium davidsonii]|nr:hypothetical protein [Gossypium davidsonii]MBA0661360.1 hypothetical protein [Gossypium klotzschianum]
VKDIYDGGGYLVLVTTDRQSAFDRILASIPFKGQTSLWWFNRTQHITPDAVLSVPDKNVATAKKCSVFPIELVEEENVQATNLPLVNPYFTYQRPSFSPIKSIKSLISTNYKNVREYVQSSKFDKYLIYGGQKEQFVTLDIPSNFPQDWIQHGYSHIHFGAVRLALNYHGTFGKPVVSRIALLDSSPGSESALIESFQADGKPLYYFKYPITGHCPWDLICSCELCHELNFEEWVVGMDNEAYKPHKKFFYKKSTQFEFYKRWINGDPNIKTQRWINGDPNISPLGEDNVKFVYLVDYSVDKMKKSSEVEQQSSSPPPPPKKDPQDQKK